MIGGLRWTIKKYIENLGKFRTFKNLQNLGKLGLVNM